MYGIGVLVGVDGSNNLKVLQHPGGRKIYSTSVIGGDYSGFKLSMDRAAEAIWNDVRSQIEE